LQFLPKSKAIEIIKNIKNALKKDGYVVISGFTTNDSLYKEGNENTRCFFIPQELKTLFSDFEIVVYEEKEIQDKGHAGFPNPHVHSVVKLIAKK